MSIKLKLIISYIFLIIFSVSIVGFQIEKKASDILFKEATGNSETITELINTTINVREDLLSKKILDNLNFVEENLNNSNTLRIDKTETNLIENNLLPSLYFKNKNLTIDNTFVSDLGESLDAVLTIFLLEDKKLFRISTNIIKGGKVATGTYIDSNSPIYQNIINNKSYYGKTLVVDSWYISAYKPLLDKDNKIIGAIGLGYKELNPYLEKNISNIKVGETGYVYIMNSNGDAILHPTIKGDNLIKYDFSKEIIEKKNGIIEYEFNGIYKLAAYKYFEPYDWYIVTTVNYDDLKSSSKAIFKTTFYTGLIIIIIGIILALVLAETLIKPINKLKYYMEVASKGDMTVYSDIKSKDEIGSLSNSFNIMITENKRLLEETVKCDKMKTEFFANISHELKTPLNIIFTTSQLFAVYINEDKEIDYVKINKYIDSLKQNCYRLIRLVNNLIDATKIDSGFMEVNFKNGNIVDIVESITLSTVDYIEGKGKNIVFDTDAEEKIMAFDAEKMERIILNLISNAIKFTREGDEIKVSIYDKNDYIIISVKDTGIGIEKEKQNTIFERFKQINPLLSRNHEGSGIGLSLVKSLVEIHKGTIQVQSTYGQGSEFIITIPVTITSNNDALDNCNYYTSQDNLEKIQIEFSDIYK
jgi:signal transduction histidine kinase